MENKKEPLMSAELYYDNNNNDKTTTSELMQDYANYVTKWQQQQNKNLYSEEDIINALHSLELKYNRDFSKIYQGIKEWFEQFKKK